MRSRRCRTALEAVKTYERAMRRGENFQAVILDATIRGGMGGVATIERLRNLDPQVVGIICSGYSDEAALAEFLQFGFRGALPKPFTRRDLADVLQRAFVAAKASQPSLDRGRSTRLTARGVGRKLRDGR